MNGKISAKFIFIVLIVGLLLMLSNKSAIADPLGSKSQAIDCEVTITPSSVEATPGVTVQFSASTVCNGDSVDGKYSWEIMEMGSTGSTINNNGLYTAGSTGGTDTVKVTDTANGDASATAQVVVKSCTPSVSINPSSASVKYAETQQFSASTVCNGDSVDGKYSWTVSGSAGGKIDASSGLYTVYTAGSTGGTDRVTVIDTINGDISATAQVMVMEYILSVGISPPSANLEFTETQQFSAFTSRNGDALAGTYSWTVSGSAGGKIDASSGLYTVYTAGSTGGTDTIQVTDTTNEDISATAQVMVMDCTPSVNISPSSASVKYTETQQFNATTSCNGDTLPGIYSWAVSGSAGGKIDSSIGLYTAGSTVGTDTVEVTDTTNGNISATAQIVVESSLSIVVSPDSMLRSRWIILPYLMTIEGTDTNFAVSSTHVSFTPAGSILGTPPLILDAESILQLTFVNSSLFLAWMEDETVTVTVTTGTEVVTDAVAIEMLPFPLDEQKNIK